MQVNRGDVNKYLQLFRVGNSVMGIVGVVVSTFMAAGLDLGDHWVNMAISAVAVFVFMCGGNALNDYIDVDIDRTAHPERPIPSGRMERKQALYAGIGMLAAAIVISFFTFDPACIVIVIVAAAFMVAYEVMLKQRGFIGNLTIALLTGGLLLLGGAVAGDIMANIVVALMAMLVSVGREICKDIEDMDSDEGRNTLPMKIGTKASATLASVFFVAGPLLSIAPMVWGTYGLLYYTVVIPDVLFLYCAVSALKDPHKAQKTAKLAMVGGLVAFILGVFPI